MDDRTENTPLRVDFAFRRLLAEKLEGHRASFCTQCGACVGDCPAARYDATFNPRRIVLLALYGAADELLGERSPVWTCTNCANCAERCPQQVKPVDIIIALKNLLADRGREPEAVGKVVEAFWQTGRTTQTGPMVDKMRAAYGLGPLAPVPVEEVRALVGPEPDEEGPVPHSGDLGPTGAIAPWREPVLTPSNDPIALFLGCLIPSRHPAMEAAIRSCLSRLGVPLVDLPGISCCPDPIYVKSRDATDWLAVAARNLCVAEAAGVDLVTSCSGCTATLSEAHHHLREPALRARVNGRLRRIGKEYKGTSAVRHVVAHLRDRVGIDAVRRSVVRPLTGLSVAVHYGCHLLKPSPVMAVDDPYDPGVLEDMVRALGATPVRHRSWALCCGKACQDEELPSAMMRDLLASVQEEEADVLCLVCPTCFGQFDHGQARVAKRFGADFHTPPVYLFQLLAFAQGTPWDQLGFDRQRFKPEALRRYE